MYAIRTEEEQCRKAGSEVATLPLTSPPSPSPASCERRVWRSQPAGRSGGTAASQSHAKPKPRGTDADFTRLRGCTKNSTNREQTDAAAVSIGLPQPNVNHTLCNVKVFLSSKNETPRRAVLRRASPRLASAKPTPTLTLTRGASGRK